MSRRNVTVLMGIGLFTSLAVVLYWILWFTAPGLVQTLSPDDHDYDTYVAFQQSFLIADSWLAATAIIGAIGLRRHRPWGFLFMLLGGSSAIFLGLMDLFFDLQHGVFSQLTAASATEFSIVVLLLFLGPVVISLTWKQFRDHRRTLYFDEESQLEKWPSGEITNIKHIKEGERNA